MEYLTIPVLRAVAMYLVLLFLARLIGRKIISQMTFFDFVIGITIGSIAANSIMGTFNDTVISGIAVVVVLTLLVIAIDYFHIKSFSFRKLVASEPIVVIEQGQLIEKNLARERYTLEELTSLLRKKNIFNIADVEYALLETDGKLSVLPKSQKQPLKPADMNVPTPYQGLTKDIIIDGVVMQENLNTVKLTNDWLTRQLGTMGVNDPKEVFYAGVDSSGNLYISNKKKEREQEGEYGIE